MMKTVSVAVGDIQFEGRILHVVGFEAASSVRLIRLCSDV